MMKKAPIALQFDHLGISYTGWATPSDERHEDGHPKSYAVVLNGVFFGNLSCDRGKWVIDERRPHELVVAAGESLSEQILGPLRAMA
jgi:hypothetical protein